MDTITLLEYDTETTTLVNHKAPLGEERDARLIQLGAKLITISLVTKEVHLRNKVSLLCNPMADFSINERAQEVHGISKQHVCQFGIPMNAALFTYNSMLEAADVVVAFNAAFDHRVVCGEASRFNSTGLTKTVELMKSTPTFCVKEAMTPVCKLPARWGYKWPKLEEAYEFCFNRTFEDAHDALVDVEAMEEVLLWWMQSEHFDINTLRKGNINFN